MWTSSSSTRTSPSWSDTWSTATHNPCQPCWRSHPRTTHTTPARTPSYAGQEACSIQRTWSASCLGFIVSIKVSSNNRGEQVKISITFILWYRRLFNKYKYKKENRKELFTTTAPGRRCARFVASGAHQLQLRRQQQPQLAPCAPQ